MILETLFSRLHHIIKLLIEFTYLYTVSEMLAKKFEFVVNLFLFMNKKIADLRISNFCVL